MQQCELYYFNLSTQYSFITSKNISAKYVPFFPGVPSSPTFSRTEAPRKENLQWMIVRVDVPWTWYNDKNNNFPRYSRYEYQETRG